MKKKFTVLLSTFILITAVAIPVAMAIEKEDSKTIKFFESMNDFHKKWLDKSLEKGEVSEDEAEQWNDHFKQMEEYHNENGINEHCKDTEILGNDDTYNQSYTNYNRGIMKMMY